MPGLATTPAKTEKLYRAARRDGLRDLARQVRRETEGDVLGDQLTLLG